MEIQRKKERMVDLSMTYMSRQILIDMVKNLPREYTPDTILMHLQRLPNRFARDNVERCDWLNNIIAGLWPLINQGLQKSLAADFLEYYGLSDVKINLGEPITIQSVSTDIDRNPDGTPNKIYLELDIQWIAGDSNEISMAYLGLLYFALVDIVIKCKLRVTIGPLLDDMYMPLEAIGP